MFVASTLTTILVDEPPILSFGIIVPAVEGTKISGPFSPTIDGLPTGGLPPLANPAKFEK